MSKLVLLGGPPGVGKSSVVHALTKAGVLCLEADDISPPNISEPRDSAINKVIRECELALSKSNVLVISWVFAREELYQPLRTHFSEHTILQLYLTCTAPVLRTRLSTRDSVDQLRYSISRLDLINQLPFDKIDTTNMDVTHVRDSILERIGIAA